MGNEFSHDSDSDLESRLNSANKVNRVKIGLKSSDTPAKVTPTASVSDSESDDGGDSAATPVVDRQITEVTLSDDENEADADGGQSQQNSDKQSEQSSSRYGLRRKRKINCAENENGPVHQVAQPIQRKGNKTFDVFSHSNERIKEIMSRPEFIDDCPKCDITICDGTGQARLSLVKKFFEKCGPGFESIFVDTARYKGRFLKSILSSTSSLGKLDYLYRNQEDSRKLLQLLKMLREENHLTGLHSLKLVGLGGSNLTEKTMSVLSELDVRFRTLELGDAIWENVQVATLEKLLERHKTTLEELVIHGGFRGAISKRRILITFPKMERLENLCICPDYTFVSEVQEPSQPKRARAIDMGREEPYKIAIKFSTDIPTLKRLVLGNLIEIEDLFFSTIRSLETFRCGSYWNLSITFPPEGSRKALTESAVTELQFPDLLKDPSFAVKVATYFPNLKKVWMTLPSVPVLRAFFKAFENSQLQELYLKTQFDFESTMESCLLPDSDVLTSPATNTVLETLKKYKHFDEYVRYYNVELPLEADHLMEGYSAGIAALTNLKILRLEHIRRRLPIPDPEDERMWHVHNFKFLDSKFGYVNYPLNNRCCKEILKMKLFQYILKNFQLEECLKECNKVGYRTKVAEDSSSEKDLSEPVHRGRGPRAQVEIMPSMLFPKIEVKPEGI